MIKITYKETTKGNHFNVFKKVTFFGVPLYTLEYSTVIQKEEDKQESKNCKQKENKIGYSYED